MKLKEIKPKIWKYTIKYTKGTKCNQILSKFKNKNFRFLGDKISEDFTSDIKIIELNGNLAIF